MSSITSTVPEVDGNKKVEAAHRVGREGSGAPYKVGGTLMKSLRPVG